MSLSPRDIQIEHFNYDLPDNRIAKFPLEKRDASKLLVFEKGVISDNNFGDIVGQLNRDDILVANQTRVVLARLEFRTQTGARIEVFCLEPTAAHFEIQTAMQKTATIEWKCLVGNAKKWKHGEILTCQVGSSTSDALQIRLIEKQGDAYRLSFVWPQKYNFAELLEKVGLLPIPPYLNRKVADSDQLRYQTVYAKDAGSVAAPTAGLHFTDSLMNKLECANVERVFLTLHVGAGTFKPVKAETLEGHEMHQEEIAISRETLTKLLACKGRIIAVGTTSLRSLESIYWTAIRLKKEPKTETVLDVKQWEPYEYTGQLPHWKVAFSELLVRMNNEQITELKGKSSLLIAPSYTLRTIDGLLTNFHQPQSTLLLLVAACIGADWRKVYDHALDTNYRFLSYGDASLLFLNKKPLTFKKSGV